MDSALQNMNPVLQLLTVMTMFSLLPFVFCCMTCFLRFTIVFSLLNKVYYVRLGSLKDVDKLLRLQILRYWG
jgi:flagellar biosynthesis protein FliP